MRKLLWVLPLLSLMGADCGSTGNCSLSKGADAGVTVLSCSDGSSATVAPEAAGTNCPFGGQKLEISSGGMTNATFACNGAPGANGANGAPGESAKVTVTDESAGANCPAGGKRIDSQVGSGAITTSYVCDGQSAVAVAEAAGNNCSNGGVKVSAPGGAVYYVCNGTNGVNGQSVTVTNEPAGNNCSNGGVKIADGATTYYVCNGINGASGDAGANGQGAAISSEAPGSNCPNGGVKITADGTIKYVCNGTNGQSVTVTNEPPGGNCPNGGVKVSGNGATQYACNGSSGGNGGGNPLGINAGPDRVVSVGTTVTLNGSAGPNVIGVKWQQVLGPAVTLSDASSLTPSFTAPSYGSAAQKTLLFELRGSDGNVMASDLVVVRLNKAPFKPFIGALYPNLVLENDTISCWLALQDPDPDGEPLTHTFKWTKNGQPFNGAQNFKEVSVVSHADTAFQDVFECVIDVTDGHAVVSSNTSSTTVARINGASGCTGSTPYGVYNVANGSQLICCGAGEHLGGYNACVVNASCSLPNTPPATCAPIGQCSSGYRNGGAGICEPGTNCSPGFQEGGNSTCVPKGTCAAGYHDGGNGTCIADGACGGGFHDGGDGTCVATGTCSSGYHDGGSGTCVLNGKCSAGFALQQDGTCAPGCPTGQHDDGKGACVSSELCAAGYHDDGAGTCVSDSANPFCANGYKNDGSGACMDTGTCAAGFKSLNGACVAYTACGSGKHDDGTGTCVADGATPACASGYHLLGGACVPDLYKVVTGGHHACALTTRGGVACWGRGLEGQLGVGDTSGSSVPRPVKGLQSGVVGLALGEFHTCALMLNGTVRCWGKNDAGQVGDGTLAGRLQPVKVTLAGTVRIPTQFELSLTAGEAHTCALTNTQGVYCWGGNTKGALGGGMSAPSLTPKAVANLPANNSLVELVSGAHHNCVRTNTQGVHCWGDNVQGQLGNGTVFDSATPSTVKVGSANFSALGLYAGHSASHTQAMSMGVFGGNMLGFISGWGDDDFAQIGKGGAAAFRSSPDVASLLFESGLPLTVNGLSGGMAHSCAITGAGRALECWGSNEQGQLGYAPFTLDMQTSTLVPAVNSPTARKPVTGLSSGVSDVSASAAFTCAVTDQGQKVQCWGTGPEGELGNGSMTPRGEPVVVSGL